MTTPSPDDRPMPLTPAEFARAVRILGLPPQQERLIDLLLRSCSDKEIAAAMDLSVHTVRTYFRRLFQRLAKQDRLSLALHIVTIGRSNGT